MIPLRIWLASAFCFHSAYAQESPHYVPDKRDFLTTILELGKSKSYDLELMTKLTGAALEPKEISAAFWRNCAFSPSKIPTFTYASYCYRIDESGRYQSAIRFGLNEKLLCITLDDLESILGRPSRYHTVAEQRHPGRTGPGYITGAAYEHATRPRAYFSLSTSSYCVTDVAHSSYRKQ